MEYQINTKVVDALALGVASLDYYYQCHGIGVLWGFMCGYMFPEMNRGQHYHFCDFDQPKMYFSRAGMLSLWRFGMSQGK